MVLNYILKSTIMVVNWSGDVCRCLIPLLTLTLLTVGGTLTLKVAVISIEPVIHRLKRHSNNLKGSVHNQNLPFHLICKSNC